MIVAAFDMGVRNFAFAVMDVDTGNVLALDAHDLGGDCFRNLIVYLKRHDALWDRADVLLIEQQLLRANIQASKLACHVHAYFLHRHPAKTVFHYPATYKTRRTGLTGTTTHRQRKQHAVQTVLRHYEETDPVVLDWVSAFDKKDDICDCLLMCSTFTQSAIYRNACSLLKTDFGCAASR